ncbi:hypothetical protein ACG7TL_009066 [Trametes sanguinea]
MAALEKFCQLYPPMTHLPEQLPPELWNPIFSDKGGYLLHYGFKITKEQANECLVRLELKRPIKSRNLDVAIICDYINSNTEGFSGYEVQVEAIADPDLFETKAVTLYSNLREGLDWFRRPYDEDRKRQVIDRVAEVLSPFTQQTEPFWYWDVFHRSTVMVVGKKSGKRTLADVMQEDMVAKRKRHDEHRAATNANGAAAAPPESSEAVPLLTVERAVTCALPFVPLREPRFGGGASRNSSSTRRTSSAQSGSGHSERQREEVGSGPDLRDVFDEWDEVTSGGEDGDWLAEREDGLASTASSTFGPETPADDIVAAAGDEDVKMLRSVAAEGSSEELEDVADGIASADAMDGDDWEASAARHASARVAHGWWAKWARSGTVTGATPEEAEAQERGAAAIGETTMTPDGRQPPPASSTASSSGLARAAVRGAHSAPQFTKRKSLFVNEEDLRATGRTRLTFTTEDVGRTSKPDGARCMSGVLSARPGSARGSKEAAAEAEEVDEEDHHDSAKVGWGASAASRTATTSVSSRNKNRL